MTDMRTSRLREYAGKLLPTLRRFRSANGAVAALEFALVTPLMVLVLAGTADVGTVVYRRMQIDEAVSASAHAALGSGTNLSAATVDTTARSIARILLAALGTAGNGDSFEISVNGGLTYSFKGAQGAATGSASVADECRCPTSTGSAIAWGSKMTCQSACLNGSVAGKFVAIGITHPHTPIFTYFGLVPNGGLNLRTVVQVQ